LFEGTGLKGESTLRRVDLTTGQVLRSRSLADRYFGEGVTVIDEHVFQLTWQDNKGWVYDRKTFERIRSFRYGGEGWGLTHNGRRLVMSNGTDVIRYRDPRTFRVTRELQVTDGGNPVTGLNELEWVEGEIFANVFPTDDVVRIDPHSGEVTGRLDLSGLHEQERNGCDPGVANGISYLPSQQRLFVTGKNWCNLYEIQPTDPPG
jgi:glutamine cyclotransferase